MSKKLLDFQKPLLGQMKTIEFNSHDITIGNNYTIYNKYGYLSLKPGNGKCVISCFRILEWLCDKLNKNNTVNLKYKSCAQISLLDGMAVSFDQYVDSDKCLIYVPTILYKQWENELLSIFPKEYYSYITFLRLKQYRKKDSIEIILSCKDDIDEVFDLAFIDGHISFSFRSNFIWILTSGFKECEISYEDFHRILIKSLVERELSLKSATDSICSSLPHFLHEFTKQLPGFENTFFFNPKKNEEYLKCIFFEIMNKSVLKEDCVGPLFEKIKECAIFGGEIEKLIPKPHILTLLYIENLKTFRIKANIDLFSALCNNHALYKHYYYLECTDYHADEEMAMRLELNKCSVCLENKVANESLLFICCRQKICRKCLCYLEITDGSNMEHGKCPCCRANYYPDKRFTFLSIFNILLKKLELASNGKKIMVICDDLYKDTKIIPHRFSNIEDFKKSEINIYYTKSCIFTKGLNMDYVWALILVNLKDSKIANILGSFQRYPRKEELLVFKFLGIR